jgi:myo-inositol-1(or 4)-monophosphatase
LNAYDVAAGIVLVREAGGQVFDFKGGDQCISRREIIATNGQISEEFVNVIKKYFN